MSTYRTSINNCKNRPVADIQATLDVAWLAKSVMDVAVTIQNNDIENYNGRVRVYITEITSTLGWNDANEKPFRFAFIDFAINQNITVGAGNAVQLKTTWDGTTAGGGGSTFGKLKRTNTMLFAVVFNNEKHTGYSDPPSGNPFDAYYVDEVVSAMPSDHIFKRRGNVNANTGSRENVLFINGSAGDIRRVFTSSAGSPLEMTMNAPPAGPSLAGFALYVVTYEAGVADLSAQPHGIGIAVIPMPLSRGTSMPPPFTVVNSIGYYSILGSPLLSSVGKAPTTIFNMSKGLPKGTYTFQGYILDNESLSNYNLSLTNAIVLTVN